MTSSRKKVIVRSLTGELTAGYLSPRAFVQRAGNPAVPVLGLLDLEGRSLPQPLSSVKLVSFVRDFNREDAANPERLTRRAFLSRPHVEGLWLRLTFSGGEQLEGVARQDLTIIDDLLEDAGIFLIPPDERANTHRIYVPRTAITALEVLAVINAPKRKTLPGHKPASGQPTLFPS